MFLIFSVGKLLTLLGVGSRTHFHPALSAYLLCLLCIILSMLVYNYILNKIFKPLTKLSEASKQITDGNYDVQIEYRGHIKELESAVSNFNRMVRELNSVEMIRNDFIANVSHEFKTPLSSIMGYITLLQDNSLSEEERQDYIQKTFFNIEKLSDLTENILQLSKLEHQNYAPASSTFRLDEQIREAIVLLEPKWSAKKIHFELELAKVTYTGAPALLFQVWMNLIGNAIKFSDCGGSIFVALRTSKEQLCVIINDEGIGMSEEVQKHIFEKFYQGDSSRKSQGNGLGLALCKQILKHCNGSIYVTSKEKEGSTFMVILN